MNLRKQAVPLLRQLLISLVFCLLLPCAAQTEAQKTRTFIIKHRKLSDTAEHLKDLFSPKAKFLIDYKNHTLKITDDQENLERIAGAIRSFDRPPIIVRIQLVIVAARLGKNGKPLKVSKLKEAQKLNQVFKYNIFEIKDKIDISSKEGEHFRLPQNRNYSLNFYMDYIDPASGAIRIKDFTLFLRRKLPAGGSVSKRLVKTDISLISGQQLIIGGSSKKDAGEAIFFILNAKTEQQ